MNTDIKKYADAGDLKSLKYVFVTALDADPTFDRYEKEYEYCKSKGLLETHCELTPFRENQADWDESYWNFLKNDLMKNFSEKRMDHMRSVAKVIFADKIQRIRAEREAAKKVKQNVQGTNPKAEAGPRKAPPGEPRPNSISKAEREKLRVQGLKEKYAQKNPDGNTKGRGNAPKEVNLPATENEESDSKKMMGIAVAVAVVAAVVVIRILL